MITSRTAIFVPNMLIIRKKKTNSQKNGTVVIKVVFKQLKNLEAKRRQPANSTVLQKTFLQSSIFQLFHTTCNALWVWISSARLQCILHRVLEKRTSQAILMNTFFKVSKTIRPIFMHKHSFLAVYHLCQANISRAQHGTSPQLYFIISIAYWKQGSRSGVFLKGLLLWKDKLVHENEEQPVDLIHIIPQA